MMEMQTMSKETQARQNNNLNEMRGMLDNNNDDDNSNNNNNNKNNNYIASTKKATRRNRDTSNNNNTKHTDDNKKETDEEIENNASPKNNNNLTERQKQVELEFRVSATATKLKKIFIEVINSGNASPISLHK